MNAEPTPLLLAALAAGAVAVAAAGARRPERSDHFDGKRFRNPGLPRGREKGFFDLVRWELTREPGPWRPYQDAPPGPRPPDRVRDGAMRVTFVNHATALVQFDGVNVLTDPIWSERSSPVSFAGPRRVRPPGIRFEDLPPIDAVVISHNHYDHLDAATVERLEQAHHPLFLAGIRNHGVLASAGARRIQELDWWEEAEVGGGVKAIAVPTQHFSNRGMFDRNEALWIGCVLKGPSGAVYFAGDTGYGAHFGQIRQRIGPIRLGLLPIGAFRPAWFMSQAHTSPEEAIAAHRDLGAATSVGIHFGTFQLADDGQDEPRERIEKALAEANPKPRFWVLEFGEGRDVPEPNPPVPLP